MSSRPDTLSSSLDIFRTNSQRSNRRYVDFAETPIDEMAAQISRGELRVQVGKTFHLDEIAEAHRSMEEKSAGGKIVVLT